MVNLTQINEDQIFENYELFIRDHRDDLSSHSGKLEMLSSDGAFRSYIDSLTEGFTPVVKRSFMAIAERQRELILEDVSVGPTSNAFGYAVHYFPILADIYSDPVLSQIATTYPVNKSIITIPRARIYASTTQMDGTSTDKIRIPSTTKLIRSTTIDISVSPNVSNNVYSLVQAASGSIDPLTSSTLNINKKYFVIKDFYITNSAASSVQMEIMLVPDVRGQFQGKFKHSDPSFIIAPGHPHNVLPTIDVTIVGNVNWDSGVLQYSATLSNPVDGQHGDYNTPGDQSSGFNTVAAPVVDIASAATSVDNITIAVMMSPRRGNKGRTEVSIQMDGWDINVDVTDDFEIRLDQEKIHDFSDIYNIDLLKILSTAIKNQMLYNKDFDLAYLLRSHEPVFKENGSYQTYDMGKYAVVGGNFTPATVMDIFRGIIPHITMVSRNIKRIFRADPQYIVCGIRTATILESLQSFMINMTSGSSGTLASELTSTGGVSFRRQTIIACESIDNDSIYIIYRAPGDLLERTAIADIIYKPLYIIDEIDESQPRTFVKSRTAIQLTAPEAIGVVKLIDTGGLHPASNLPVGANYTLDALLGTI